MRGIVGHHAEAVRADEPDVVLARDPEHLALHRGALGPELAEARRR